MRALNNACWFVMIVLAHTGRKQYKRGMALLLLGLTAPTHVVNAITVAIYKKYILLSLLLQGMHTFWW